MSSKTTKIALIVVLVVVGIGAVAGLTYYLQQRRIDQLSAQVRAKQAELVALKAQADAASALLESAAESSTTAGETEDAAADTSDAEPSTSKPEPTTTRQSAFVRKATDKNGKLSLVLDFAQFLTGEAAADAAAAAGDESPPPNDYYISNTNPKLRTFPVSTKAKFVVAYGDPNDTDTLSASDFVEAIDENKDGVADALYWFIITNGVVTGGEQQWLP